MPHVMKWSDHNHTATCSCGLVLIVSSSRELAAIHHTSHVQTEQVRPTSPATVKLASIGFARWSGYHHKSERNA